MRVNSEIKKNIHRNTQRSDHDKSHLLDKLTGVKKFRHQLAIKFDVLFEMSQFIKWSSVFMSCFVIAESFGIVHI